MGVKRARSEVPFLMFDLTIVYMFASTFYFCFPLFVLPLPKYSFSFESMSLFNMIMLVHYLPSLSQYFY